MTRLSQVGFAFVCLGLVAPVAARADTVSVMSAMYETSFVQAAVDHEQATEHTQKSIFSWCRRCSAADASPYLVNTDLNALSSGPGNGMTVVFNGGFTATFGGVMTLPVPALSSGMTPGSNTPTITLPISLSSNDDAPPAGGSGGGSVADPGAGPSVHGLVAGTTSTAHTVLTKAESLAPTPEPATLLLLATGLIGIAGGRALKQRV